MNSVTTEKFRFQYAAAPATTQNRVRAAYRQWTENANHPSLRFKKVHDRLPIFSDRVDLDWRAVGVIKDVIWFFARPHSEYEKPLHQL